MLEAMGQRARRGGGGSNQHESKRATVARLQKTTADIAKEAGMSERTWLPRLTEHARVLSGGQFDDLPEKIVGSECPVSQSTPAYPIFAGHSHPPPERSRRRIGTHGLTYRYSGRVDLRGVVRDGISTHEEAGASEENPGPRRVSRSRELRGAR